MGTSMTVEETFSYLNKQFGVLNIKQLSELPPTRDDIVSTGIMGLILPLVSAVSRREVLLRFMHLKAQEKRHLHYSYANSIRRINRYCT